MTVCVLKNKVLCCGGGVMQEVFGEMNFSLRFLFEEMVWDDRNERCLLDWRQVMPLVRNEAGLGLRTCWL